MRERTRTLAFGGLFTALVAAGAFIQIPVPYLDYFTLQFFFVLLAGMILGPKRGAASVGCYVLLGLLGLPIFAAGGGIGYVLRPSFGFLAAFIVAAYGVGWIAERQKNMARGMLKAALLGLLITYGIGLLYKYLNFEFLFGNKNFPFCDFTFLFPVGSSGRSGALFFGCRDSAETTKDNRAYAIGGLRWRQN